jgi:hypothetical protein
MKVQTGKALVLLVRLHRKLFGADASKRDVASSTSFGS